MTNEFDVCVASMADPSPCTCGDVGGSGVNGFHIGIVVVVVHHLVNGIPSPCPPAPTPNATVKEMMIHVGECKLCAAEDNSIPRSNRDIPPGLHIRPMSWVETSALFTGIIMALFGVVAKHRRRSSDRDPMRVFSTPPFLPIYACPHYSGDLL